MNPESTQITPNSNSDTEPANKKSLDVGKVFLIIYSLMTIVFFAIFILGSASGGENSGITSIALIVNGLIIVPVSYFIVFIIHMIVLAMERSNNKTSQVQIDTPRQFGLGSLVKSVIIGIILFFVGIMCFMAYSFYIS